MAPIFTRFLPLNPYQALGNLPIGEPSTTSLYNGSHSFLLSFLILKILKLFPQSFSSPFPFKSRTILGDVCKMEAEVALSHGKMRKFGIGKLGFQSWHQSLGFPWSYRSFEPQFPHLYNVDDNSRSIPLPGVCE